MSHFHTTKQYPVKRDKHRDLNQYRQAAAKRIDLLCLVQLHHGLLHLLAVVAKFFLHALQARGQFTQMRHGTIAGSRKRIESQFDQNRQQNDGNTPVINQFLNG